jgi:hypothetical protein
MQNTPKTIMKWSPSMRGQYVHQATVLMAAGSDPSAPGAAITLELCGSWEHEPPCPLAPHHTDYARNGNDVTLRIVFAAEPEKEGGRAAPDRKGPGRRVAHQTGRSEDELDLSWRRSRRAECSRTGTGQADRRSLGPAGLVRRALGKRLVKRTRA